jgi:hypothetical protein
MRLDEALRHPELGDYCRSLKRYGRQRLNDFVNMTLRQLSDEADDGARQLALAIPEDSRLGLCEWGELFDVMTQGRRLRPRGADSRLGAVAYSLGRFLPVSPFSWENRLVAGLATNH